MARLPGGHTEDDVATRGGLHTALHSYTHVARPYFKRLTRSASPEARYQGAPWSVPDLCKAYNWPTGLAGGGVIAIVELGGGWVQSDMDKFFGGLGQPVPHITDISVDGTKNTPTSANSPDGEVALDIDVAGAAYYVATGKAATIRVYWAQDIATAVRAATADGCDVCSISWGSDEANWGAQAGQEMEQAAADATAAGMIVLAASGDNDSSDGGLNPANVDLPASAPHVIACGGTRKTTTSETVWNNDPGSSSGMGTGGGFSTLFKPMPDWQICAPNGPARMVPDVSANADPDTGYQIILHGQEETIGGTSAVAPLYAGLFAAFGTKFGFISPYLWKNQISFNDITAGDNGWLRARQGPDPCTGLGSPIATKLAQMMLWVQMVRETSRHPLIADAPSPPPEDRKRPTISPALERFPERDFGLAHAIADNSLAVFLGSSGPDESSETILSNWIKAVSSLEPTTKDIPQMSMELDSRNTETANAAIQIILPSRSYPQLLGRLQLAASLVYQQLTTPQRIREAGHLLVGLGFWFAYLAWVRPPVSMLLAFLMTPAYADVDATSAVKMHMILASVFAVAITVVLVMSAYAALIRKPPLDSGREFLKLTLAFASGVVSSALAAP